VIRRSRTLPALGLVAAAAFLALACDVETEGGDELGGDTLAEGSMPDSSADSQLREVYEASLAGVGESGATGTATLTVGEELLVTVEATGLEPETRYPMHVHMNAACDDAGGILLNLDDGLTAPDEGEARGDAYAETDEDGRLQYEVSRALDEIIGADSLDLANRVVNVHGPEMQPVACGPLDRGRRGQTPATGS
jgi:Cu/Zn superoxide dismutase